MHEFFLFYNTHILAPCKKIKHIISAVRETTYRVFSLLNLFSVSQYYLRCCNMRDLSIAEGTDTAFAPLVFNAVYAEMNK